MTMSSNTSNSRTRINRTRYNSPLFLRSAILIALCVLFVGGNNLFVDADATFHEGEGMKAAVSSGLEPPAGLFAKLDTSHDSHISEVEFKAGWPLIVQEFSYSWLPANNGGFMKGFTSGVAMILATEIGDKTFFIAAVLSMRQQRSAVFLGAVASLYVMTVLSSIMGLVLPKLVPVKYTHILGGILFLYFGIKLLLDARGMDNDQVSEELEEVEEELLHPKKDDSDPESQAVVSSNSMRKGFSQIAMQSFTLTFLAEWGDRSQIATIALAAAKNPYGVTLGGCIGHTMCTGMAVLGGRMLAARISEKTVSIFGGLIFLVFGVHSVFFES